MIIHLHQDIAGDQRVGRVIMDNTNFKVFAIRTGSLCRGHVSHALLYEWNLWEMSPPRISQPLDDLFFMIDCCFYCPQCMIKRHNALLTCERHINIVDLSIRLAFPFLDVSVDPHTSMRVIPFLDCTWCPRYIRHWNTGQQFCWRGSRPALYKDKGRAHLWQPPDPHHQVTCNIRSDWTMKLIDGYCIDEGSL